MPLLNENGTVDHTTGTSILASSGWYQADCAARNTEDLFKESNKQFDRIFVEILRRRGLLDIGLGDFELHIDRGETVNIQAKAQSFQTLLSAGLHPELAAQKSGVSNDPVADIKKSKKYLDMIWGNPDKVDEVEQQTNGQGEAEIVERDSDNGENQTGGAV